MQAAVDPVGGALSLQFDPVSHAPPELLVQVSHAAGAAAAAGGADATIEASTMPADEPIKASAASARTIRGASTVERAVVSALVILASFAPSLVRSEAAMPPASHAACAASSASPTHAR